MDSVVFISDACLDDLVLQAVDAFQHGDNHSDDGRKGLETIGVAWGRRQFSEEGGEPVEAKFFVEKCLLSLSAIRHQDWVTPDPAAMKALADTMDLMNPQYELLGDFHTHPYDDLDKVNQAKGWEWSRQDKRYFKENFVWEHTNNMPLFLICAITRMQRVRENYDAVAYDRNGVLTLNVGQFRIWINAYHGYMKKGKRSLHEDCVVTLPFFYKSHNPSGTRV